ncbi:MAG: TIGR00282 family metallophosphoesterase [Thermodesulfovibrionales bacterium]|nr:TIGR00282 family metallophosphoesterase [Thermodesulfovibrionales bacterium]
MKVLFVGDIVGKPGRMALKALLPGITDSHGVELVIVNGENSAAGFGITKKVGNELFAIGVHVVTSGNHIWDKKEALEYLDSEQKVIRPLNYPPGVPGFGSVVHESASGAKVAVINLAGRVFMPPLDCPFRKLEAELDRLGDSVDMVIVDFHAEATSEKVAMGQYFDGKVSAMLGTHTHVQTADECVLPGGTAYITDVGMSGPVNSVIGVDSKRIFERFLTHVPVRFEVAHGPSMLCAVVVDIDEKTARARSIERIQLHHS